MHRKILLASLPILSATMAMGVASPFFGTAAVALGSPSLAGLAWQPPNGCGCETACQSSCDASCDCGDGYVMTSREWHPCLHPSRKRPSQFADRFKESIDRFGDRLERCVNRIPIRIHFSAGDACDSRCSETCCDESPDCMRVWDSYASPSMGSQAATNVEDASPSNRKSHPVSKGVPRTNSQVAPPIPNDAMQFQGQPEAAPSPSDLRHDPFQDEAFNGSQRRRFSDSKRDAEGLVRRRLQGDLDAVAPAVVVSEEVVTKRLLNESHFALRTASAESPTVTTAEPLRVANGVRRSVVDSKPSKTAASSDELRFTLPSAEEVRLTPTVKQSKLRLIPVPHDND